MASPKSTALDGSGMAVALATVISPGVLKNVTRLGG